MKRRIRMQANKTIVLGLGLSLLFVASTATAEDRPPKASEVKQASGWVYAFDDDPLAGAGPDLNAPRIQVLAHALRQQLIRPRATFVTEMIKSVENL
jgi:hypothetical protein